LGKVFRLIELFLRLIFPFESRVDAANVVPNSFVGARLLFFEDGEPPEIEKYGII